MTSNILVVDDDSAFVENLEALLESKGYGVSCVFDGEAGISAARSQMPDLILLDIRLPKMGGFDVCRLLKADPATQKIKVVMITGLGHIGDVETAYKNGADDFLSKPFESAKLFEKMNKVLQN